MLAARHALGQDARFDFVAYTVRRNGASLHVTSQGRGRGAHAAGDPRGRARPTRARRVRRAARGGRRAARARLAADGVQPLPDPRGARGRGPARPRRRAPRKRRPLAPTRERGLCRRRRDRRLPRAQLQAGVRAHGDPLGGRAAEWPGAPPRARRRAPAEHLAHRAGARVSRRHPRARARCHRAHPRGALLPGLARRAHRSRRAARAAHHRVPPLPTTRAASPRSTSGPGRSLIAASCRTGS